MLKQQCPFELPLPDSCFILHPTASRSNTTSHTHTHTHTHTHAHTPTVPVPLGPFLCHPGSVTLAVSVYQQLVWHLLDKCNRLLNKTLPLSGAALWPAPLLSHSLYVCLIDTHTHTHIHKYTHGVPAKPACWAAMKTYTQHTEGSMDT